MCVTNCVSEWMIIVFVILHIAYDSPYDQFVLHALNQYSVLYDFAMIANGVPWNL